MKISEIVVDDVARYLRLETGDYEPSEIAAIMTAATEYIASYTGIPATSSVIGTETLDNHEDFYIAYMVLCQDMYDNRAMYVDKSNINRVVETILGMHSVNLL